MSRDKRYQKLLNSPRWAEVKRIVWQRAGGLCERCKREGFITAGVDCHHIKPVEGAHTVDGPDGMRARAYNPENIELLCIACHIKTHQEMHSHKKEQVAENKARARRRFLEANDPNFASEREQDDACISPAEREQSRTKYNYGRDNERPQGQDVDSHEDGQRGFSSSAEHDEG